MNVFIDADGCPVLQTAVMLCLENRIPCTIVCDTAHEFSWNGVATLVVDKGADSVDYAIANRIQPSDLVITQDYGLASMCLAMHARVLHQDGWEYTEENIDTLLFQRHAAKKLRARGIRLHGPSKRTQDQNKKFELSFRKILQISVQG